MKSHKLRDFILQTNTFAMNFCKMLNSDTVHLKIKGLLSSAITHKYIVFNVFTHNSAWLFASATPESRHSETILTSISDGDR